MNTDTPDTTLPGEDADYVPEVVADDPGEVVAAPHKLNPAVYIGLGIALLAMGQDFLEQGLNELTRASGRAPRALR